MDATDGTPLPTPDLSVLLDPLIRWREQTPDRRVFDRDGWRYTFVRDAATDRFAVASVERV